MKHWPKHLGSIVFVALFLISGKTNAELIVQDNFDTGYSYSSGQFNGADFGDYADDISFADFSIQSSGGNPGGSMQISHNHDVDRDGSGVPSGGDGSSLVQSYFTLQDITYNPQADGSFNSISFSLDYNTSDPFSFAYFSVNSTFGGAFAGFDGVVNDGEWHTYQKSFTQSDFAGFDFSGAEDLTFGFGFYSYLDVSDGAYSSVLSADNFSVSLSAVPEPSSLILVSIPAFLATIRRKNRSITQAVSC